MTEIEHATNVNEPWPTPDEDNAAALADAPTLRTRTSPPTGRTARRLMAAALIMTCSVALGAEDPWAHREETGSVTINARRAPRRRWLSWDDAIRKVWEFNARIERQYAELAAAEAADEAWWGEDDDL